MRKIQFYSFFNFQNPLFITMEQQIFISNFTVFSLDLKFNVIKSNLSNHVLKLNLIAMSHTKFQIQFYLEIKKTFQYLTLKMFISKLNSKGVLSCLRQFLATESPSKMIKNVYFTLKALFFLKIFNFLSSLFWLCRKTA